jgi:hypothetical protein
MHWSSAPLYLARDRKKPRMAVIPAMLKTIQTVLGRWCLINPEATANNNIEATTKKRSLKSRSGFGPLEVSSVTVACSDAARSWERFIRSSESGISGGTDSIH